MEAGAIRAGALPHHDDHEHHGPPEANRSSRVEPQLLGMLLFIISEVMVFGAFFTAYFFIRVVTGDEWFPVDGHKLPVAVAGFNTAILVSSSFTMHWAETSIKNGNRRGLQAGILSTFLLGATFLFIQINEYIHIGFAPHDFAQASVFFGLTGLHGAHVFVGLTLLAMVVVRSWRGHYSPEEHRGVEVPGIYWHFVDIMWIVVYSSVYVL
jgi:cytochrome c oxidase subunit III